MAIDNSPTTWLASYDYSASTLHIPLAALSGLVAGDCDPTTGDIRKILLAIGKTALAKQESFSAPNRSTKLSITVATTPTTTAYRFAFTGAVSTFIVAAE